MKRANVWKAGVSACEWRVDIEDDYGVLLYAKHPFTYAEALAHALTAVGLDRPAEHREAP